MFRKPKSKKKQALRKRSVEEDDDDDTQSDLSQRIQQTQKKQRILASLPVASGEIGKKNWFQRNQAKREKEETNEEEANVSILAKKHQQAMEDFIQENLQDKKKSEESTKDTSETSTKTPLNEEEALYQELARATAPSKLQQEQDESKGAILVGGTGIAEVILPKTKSGKTTEPDKSQAFKVLRRDWAFHRKDPQASSAVPIASDPSTKQQTQPVLGSNPESTSSSATDSKAIPTSQVSSVSAPVSFRSMVPSANAQPSSQRTTSETPDETQQTKAPPGAADDARVGFSAYRHGQKKSTTSSSSSHQDQNQNKKTTQQRDHEFFVKFVQRQRDKR